ncbi:MAG: Lrp/AsnC family transcriptional regulator [Chloroflexi bacterium]|nr:Lrp/AsnC family transcriptional regulator [Chloroflexota bacterium]
MMKDILKILEQNAKATPEEISEMTGHTPEEVRETIAQAERDRAIVKYKTIINWDRAGVGAQEVMALVELRVTPQRDVGFDGVAKRIARFPEVRSLQLMSGDFDLSVLLVGPTMQEVASFVAMKLAALEEVQGTTTHFLLKRFKEDGVILDGEEVAKRLPLTP